MEQTSNYLAFDLGAESARTNRGPISEQEEADRLGAFLGLWREESARWPSVWLSINTWRPAVVRAVLPEGGDLQQAVDQPAAAEAVPLLPPAAGFPATPAPMQMLLRVRAEIKNDHFRPICPPIGCLSYRGTL